MGLWLVCCVYTGTHEIANFSIKSIIGPYGLVSLDAIVDIIVSYFLEGVTHCVPKPFWDILLVCLFICRSTWRFIVMYWGKWRFIVMYWGKWRFLCRANLLAPHYTGAPLLVLTVWMVFDGGGYKKPPGGTGGCAGSLERGVT